MKLRLLVIPNDPLWAYDRKGYSKEGRQNYYNPDKEFEVSILGVEEKEESLFEYAGFKVYPSNRELKGIEKIMERVKPNSVRAYNGTWGAELAGRIGDDYGIPSITSVHNLFPEKEVNNVDKIICVSEEVKRRCIKNGAEESKLVVITDGVDCDVFKDYGGTEKVDKLNKQYSSKHKILSMGRLVWQKNLENLFEASKIVHGNLKDITHLHIGNLGSLNLEVTQKIKKLNAEEYIHILSNVKQEETPYFYSWADAFTMASVSEGCGLVYLEALACETPVVTSNISPMNSYILEGYNGLLVNPESPEDIAEKIYEILINKSLHKKLQLNTRKSVERFDIKELKKQEVKLYRGMLR